MKEMMMKKMMKEKKMKEMKMKEMKMKEMMMKKMMKRKQAEPDSWKDSGDSEMLEPFEDSSDFQEISDSLDFPDFSENPKLSLPHFPTKACNAYSPYAPQEAAPPAHTSHALPAPCLQPPRQLPHNHP